MRRATKVLLPRLPRLCFWFLIVWFQCCSFCLLRFSWLKTKRVFICSVLQTWCCRQLHFLRFYCMTSIQLLLCFSVSSKQSSKKQHFIMCCCLHCVDITNFYFITFMNLESCLVCECTPDKKVSVSDSNKTGESAALELMGDFRDPNSYLRY